MALGHAVNVLDEGLLQDRQLCQACTPVWPVHPYHRTQSTRSQLGMQLVHIRPPFYRRGLQLKFGLRGLGWVHSSSYCMGHDGKKVVSESFLGIKKEAEGPQCFKLNLNLKGFSNKLSGP